MRKDKKRSSYGTAIVDRFNKCRYFKTHKNELVQKGRWTFEGFLIAEKTEERGVVVHWNTGNLNRKRVLKRMKAITRFYGVPVPMEEDGWITVKAGKPSKPLALDEALRLARHLFYFETAADVDESVFYEIFIRFLHAGKTKDDWLAENPKQSIIWIITERVYKMGVVI